LVVPTAEDRTSIADVQASLEAPSADSLRLFPMLSSKSHTLKKYFLIFTA
jgi:hypothetical protein